MKRDIKLKIKRLHRNNLTFQEIADYLNIPLQKVEYVLSAKRGKAKIDEWIIQKINAMANEGKHRIEIAQHLHVAVSTVIKYSHKNAKTEYKYLLQAPDNQIHKVSNLIVFCKENNLNYRMMRKTIEGITSHHKNWKCNDWKKSYSHRK